MAVVVIPSSGLRCLCNLFAKHEGGLLDREVRVLGQELKKEMALCMGNYKAK